MRTAGRLWVLQRSQSLLVPGTMGSPSIKWRAAETSHLNQMKSSICSFLHNVTLLPASPANCPPPSLCKEIEPLPQLFLWNQTSGKIVGNMLRGSRKNFQALKTRFVPRCPDVPLSQMNLDPSQCLTICLKSVLPTRSFDGPKRTSTGIVANSS